MTPALPGVVSASMRPVIQLAGETTASVSGPGSTSQGSSNGVDITTEEVARLGSRTVGLAPDAGQARTDVLNAAGNPAAFSTFPLASALAKQYEGVNGVFVETLAGLEAEITEFGENLIAAANRYIEADEESAAALSWISSHIDQGTNTVTAEESRIARTGNESLRIDESVDSVGAVDGDNF